MYNLHQRFYLKFSLIINALTQPKGAAQWNSGVDADDDGALMIVPCCVVPCRAVLYRKFRSLNESNKKYKKVDLLHYLSLIRLLPIRLLLYHSLLIYLFIKQWKKNRIKTRQSYYQINRIYWNAWINQQEVKKKIFQTRPETKTCEKPDWEIHTHTYTQTAIG